ncbi:MAG: TerB N-terminal domain-containing protein [Gemmobacter sp.]|nr:TerB N-terminal domain-containing protein [Gemmobacter sp.]
MPGGQNATVQGVGVGGLVYIGPPLRDGKPDHGQPRCWIDPALSARSATRDPEGRGLTYWPSYRDLPPESRATYLDWLASGRQDATCNPGYMFMYFYGLEHRFLRDASPEAERREIIAEVARLHDLWSASGSARRYLGEFINFAGLQMDGPPSEPSKAERSWELPLQLKAGVGARILRGQALTADWLLAWFIAHPETRLRTPATRCAPEFEALFRHVFEARFPDGLTPRMPRKVLTASYCAASGTFEVSFQPQIDGRAVPDVSGLKSPLTAAHAIAEQATDRLAGLSRYLGRNPQGRGTLEAAALLPIEIAGIFPSEGLAALADWAGDVVAMGGTVPVEDLLIRLEGEVPKRIGRRQLADAAAALARIGFGMAPDADFSLRGPRIGEPVVLFAAGASPDGPPTEAYRSAMLQLAPGAALAQADGVVSPGERAALAARISGISGLAAGEATRLAANLDWLLAVPADMAAIRARIADASPAAKEGLRVALIAMAVGAGELIGPAEVGRIEQVYRMMGLDPGQAYSDLHAGATTDAPITVRLAERPEAGEPIPVFGPDRESGIALDINRIAAIRADTEAASKVLGAIFADAPDPVSDDADPPPATAAAELPAALFGLEPRQAAFVRAVIARAHCTEEDMAGLAEAHGLMAAGAVEAVNEWSFARHDEAILEFYGDYEINAGIAAALTAALQEDSHVNTQTP